MNPQILEETTSRFYKMKMYEMRIAKKEKAMIATEYIYFYAHGIITL